MRVRVIAVLIFLSFLCSCASGGAGNIKDYWEAKGLTGKWQGQARLSLPWVRQDNLKVHLEILPGGAINGKIGDAVLKDGLIARERGWLEKSVSVGTDYLVTGRLIGNVVKCDGIHRQSVEIRLDFKDGRLVGEVITSGFEFGGRDRMMLIAPDLILTKPVS